MTDLHPFPESVSTAAEGETRRFRASTYEAAMALAVEELGVNVRSIEANRIRRGGLGGFFATDLGVEVTVVVDTESSAESQPEQRGGGFDHTEGPVEESLLRPARDPDPSGDTPGNVVSPQVPHLDRADRFVEEVLALSEEGMDSLLNEMQHAQHTEPVTFADHLERCDEQFELIDFEQVELASPASAPSESEFAGHLGEPQEQASEPSFAERLRETAHADLERQTERLREADRRRRDESDFSAEHWPAQPPVEGGAAPETAEVGIADAAAQAADAAVQAADAAAQAADAAVQAAEVATQRSETARAAAAQAAQERQAFEQATAGRVAAEQDTSEHVAPVDDALAVPVVEVPVVEVPVVEVPVVEVPVVEVPVVEVPVVEVPVVEVPVVAAPAFEAPVFVEPVFAAPVFAAPVFAAPVADVPVAAASPDADPLRRPAELAAAATDRLVSRLAAVVAADGSRLQDLHRVRVAVTTLDGTMIEMTAEMGGQA